MSIGLSGQRFTVKSDIVDVLCSRGVALGKLDRHAEALASFEQALAISPTCLPALYNRGVMLANLDRHAEAVESYDRALKTDPAHAKALNNRGVALASLDRYEDAIASFDRALALRPDFAEALLNRGLTLADLGRYEDAILDYDRALTIDPGYAEALFNRATALASLNRHGEALAEFDKAIAIVPRYADAICNRGVVLEQLDRHAEAVAAFCQAAAVEPGHREANWNEGLALLRQGNFRDGWAKYEWRWASKELASQRREFAQPLWVGGEDLHGKTILLHAEQGFGDTIQFVRYAPLVARLGARVVLQVQASLQQLLARTAGVSQVLGKTDPLPEFDVHCPLLSLPLAFRTEVDTIPAHVPYVAAPQAHAAKWRDRLGQRTALRVGIAWAGSPSNKNDRNRSIPLDRFACVLSLPDIAFVSIQKDIGENERRILRDAAHAIHLGDQLADFADTAAAISCLDLVISADTAVAHLAGATGTPVWILVPFAPDFRWMLDRNDSPWYPTARLFRQPRIGDWDSVLGRLRQELSGWVEVAGRRCSPASHEDSLKL